MVVEFGTPVELAIFVNGQKIDSQLVAGEELSSATQFIRQKLRLTGTKVACGEGGCGSCSLIVSKYSLSQNKFVHKTINGCITPLILLHECHILTIEGIGDPHNGVITKIQDSIATGNGTQCGFCTPGIIMSAECLFENVASPNVEQIHQSLQGNLCRCTGYRPILESLLKCSLSNCSKESSNFCLDIEDLKSQCSGRTLIEPDRKVKEFGRLRQKDINLILETQKNQDVEVEGTKFIKLRNQSYFWFPSSLAELSELLGKFPNSTIIGGGLDYRSSTNKEQNLIMLNNVREMNSIFKEESGITFGAAVTISDVLKTLEEEIRVKPRVKTAIYAATVKLLKRYGSEQIRNIATLGGSLKTNNPASDIQTLAFGFGWKITVLKGTSPATVYANEVTYKDAIICQVIIPLDEDGVVGAFSEKYSKRLWNDVALLNVAAMHRPGSELQISFGGKGVSRHSENPYFNLDMTGKDWISHKNHIWAWMKLKSYRLFGETEDSQYMEQLLESAFNAMFEIFSAGDNSDLKTMLGINFKASQMTTLVSSNQPEHDLIGRPVPHSSAFKHTTGEAKYLDDMPKYENEMHLGLILSTRAHAKIIRIDTSKAKLLNGVKGFVFKDDIQTKEQNMFGIALQDEEVFASDKVLAVGSIIGGVVACDSNIANTAAKLVEIEYEDITPQILTINDAIKYKSFIDGFGMKLERGDCAAAFNLCSVLTGNFNVGSQAHFYMEPQGCIAIPKGEDGEIEVISSTQFPSEIQHQVAHKLGIPANRVVVKVKRVGGGFGGKESRCLLVALPTAVAANKFGIPVRCVLKRETDMLISGKRDEFQVDYKVGFTGDGKIQGLEMTVYSNSGYSLDVTHASIERGLVNMDNAYNIPNMKLEGIICKTNIASNTAFRGTGAPQAVLIMENIMDKVANFLKIEPTNVRKLNMYNEGDVTPYGQKLYNSTIHPCWDECLEKSNYWEQKKLVEEFNSKNKYKKRGISINPVHYGIAFSALFLNQASALIHIYQDGSVLVSHGGVEIGQGIHSKMVQVVTRELGIPASKIRILDTATDKVPNAPTSSASVSSDLNGMAVMEACKKLIKRLEPYLVDLSCKSWEESIKKAYMDRISLSATGFYRTPGIGWDENRKGSPFNYFSCGACCSIIELDCLTGHHQIIRTDIVMDVGQSLNPSIDIGQIEGAFMQGVGLYTTEELEFDFKNEGRLLTTGPISYKIPTISDTPQEFNVSFLTGSKNKRAIYSSKTVGEPPLLLSTSVFLAIKDAIRSYRLSLGNDVNFDLYSPATVKRILFACNEINERCNS